MFLQTQFQTEHKEESVNQKPDTDETEVDETEVLDDATDKEIPTDTGYQTEQSNKQTEGKVIDSQTDVPNDTGNTGVPINSADNAEAQSKYQDDGKPIDSPEDKKVEDQQKTISTKDDEKVVDETDLDDELDETGMLDYESISDGYSFLCPFVLTLYQTTNFRLFQTGRVCRRQFHI